MATRLLREALLEHPVREAIHDHVRERPGITFLELFGRLRSHPDFGPSIGHGNLLHHLHRLERFGFVTHRKSARSRRYYQNGGPWTGGTTALALLQTDPIPILAQLLLENPGVSQTGLWHAFRAHRPCSRQVIGYHLARLVAEELVVAARRGGSNAYYGTERLRGLMTFVTPPPKPGMPIPESALRPVLVEA